MTTSPTTRPEETSDPPRRILPAALATVVIATAGVFVGWMVIPPETSSIVVDHGVAESPERTDSSTPLVPSSARGPFPSPARTRTPASEAEDERETAAPPALIGRVVNTDAAPIPRAIIRLARTDVSGPGMRPHAPTRRAGSS